MTDDDAKKQVIQAHKMGGDVTVDCTPNEELRALVDRWRKKAPTKTDSERRRVGKIIAHQCADELEELIND